MRRAILTMYRRCSRSTLVIRRWGARRVAGVRPWDPAAKCAKKFRSMGAAGESLRHIAPRPAPNEHGLPRPAPDPAAAAELERALGAGDRACAIRLIDEQFGAGLFRFIHALVRNADLADDVYQTTLLEAYRDLGAFEARSSVRTWLFGIARHRCLDALRRSKRRDEPLVSSAELPEPADSAPGPDQQLDDAQLRTALERCLDRLAVDLRMVLVMRFSEGLPYDDIARICQASNEAIRARVSRVLPVLRRCIERTGAL
jgi:RNA polymerase sigma-70 factor (ECF subfamily)